MTDLFDDIAFIADDVVKDLCVDKYTHCFNSFSTKLEALRMAERFNLELEISKFIKDNHGEVDWENDSKQKFVITYKYNKEKPLFFIDDNYKQQTIGLPYFNSLHLAEQAIEIYGKRLKFAWGVNNENPKI